MTGLTLRPLDVCDGEAVKGLVGGFDVLDVVVNCAQADSHNAAGPHGALALAVCA